MLNEDRKTDENKILITIFAFHCLNYNTFMKTLIFFAPFVMISTYTMLLA